MTQDAINVRRTEMNKVAIRSGVRERATHCVDFLHRQKGMKIQKFGSALIQDGLRLDNMYQRLPGLFESMIEPAIKEVTIKSMQFTITSREDSRVAKNLQG